MPPIIFKQNICRVIEVVGTDSGIGAISKWTATFEFIPEKLYVVAENRLDRRILKPQTLKDNVGVCVIHIQA